MTLRGDGTAKSGYVPPALGPFKCERCIHFVEPRHCGHPEVIEDPAVRGKVEPDGCCNYFRHGKLTTKFF